ncbi:MAG: hypothetical protein KDC38_08680, partial [Planctomycetes bacterium]|nr:hypothetical protein [Planctomycetota bacterium]
MRLVRWGTVLCLLTLLFPNEGTAQTGGPPSFTPSVASYLGEMTFHIQNNDPSFPLFQPPNPTQWQVTIDGVPAAITGMGGMFMNGVIPAHAPTTEPVDVVCFNVQTLQTITLPDVLTYSGPLAVNAVTPTSTE